MGKLELISGKMSLQVNRCLSHRLGAECLFPFLIKEEEKGSERETNTGPLKNTCTLAQKYALKKNYCL